MNELLRFVLIGAVITVFGTYTLYYYKRSRYKVQLYITFMVLTMVIRIGMHFYTKEEGLALNPFLIASVLWFIAVFFMKDKKLLSDRTKKRYKK